MMYSKKIRGSNRFATFPIVTFSISDNAVSPFFFGNGLECRLPPTSLHRGFPSGEPAWRHYTRQTSRASGWRAADFPSPRSSAMFIANGGPEMKITSYEATTLHIPEDD